jgi:hypothetical protein
MGEMFLFHTIYLYYNLNKRIKQELSKQMFV